MEFYVYGYEELTEEMKMEWNAFVSSLPPLQQTIYQSFLWSEVLTSLLSKENITLCILKDKNTGKICVGSFVYMYPLTSTYYWLYLPRGPLFGGEITGEDIGYFFSQLQNTYTRAVWIRFDPSQDSKEENLWIKYKKSHKEFHPKRTLLLPLKSKTSEDILAQMHPKGRYNIRVAEKKGVSIYGWNVQDGQVHSLFPVETMDEVNPVELFAQMIVETAKRDGFSVHSEEYFFQFLNTLGSKHAFLYLAKYENEWIAGGIFTLFGDTLTYYYGASKHEYRNLMAPYLVQWKAIQTALEEKMADYYDFLGIGDGTPEDPLRGVTEFKRKFGGEVREYVGTYEIVCKPLLYRSILFLKWVKKVLKK